MNQRFKRNPRRTDMHRSFVARRAAGGWLSSAARGLWRCERGVDFVEMVIVAPVLLALSFGILELGHALSNAHAMSSLTREGANIAARGTELDTVLAVTMLNGASIGLNGRGGTVVSRIRIESGVPTVREQVASSGYSTRSRLGLVDSVATRLTGVSLAEGQELYAVELFYDHQKLTPLSRLVGSIVPDTMYDFAVF